MKILLTLFSILLTNISYANLLPLAASYDGVGGVAGAGYSHEFGNGHKVLVGGVGGDLTAFGGLYTLSFNQDFELSFGTVFFDQVQLTTTYERGLADDEDNRYLLNLKGHAYALGSKLWLLDSYLLLGFSASQFTVEFDSVEDGGQNEINLAGANLFDIETTQIKLSVEGRFYDDPRAPKKGLGVFTSLSHISGRTGQSDQMLLDYGFNGVLPVSPFFTFIGKAKHSDALVEVNKKYDTDSEVRDALDADCSTIADAGERSKCERLENDLVDYIVDNNNRGTALPIGGSGGPRSFRQLRFRAAHTAVYSLEAHTSLSQMFKMMNKKDTDLSLFVFHDIGYADDDKTELFKKSVVSNGAGLKLARGTNSINLQAAKGSDDSSSWSLAFGSGI
ncbi:MAG: hypothetical protein CME62_06075 [Halobacteriovoraceae bacterium]|nr:hypothetical protein [Halobacteriovoraceae bacterium]